MDSERCVCCGEIIPEGRQVCPQCEKGTGGVKMANEKPCGFCKGRAYTKKPVTIITAYGKRFQIVFEHCPNCGRKLRTEDGK